MAAVSGNSSLRFAVSRAEGRHVLAMRPHLLWDLVAVERLELEVPSSPDDPPLGQETAPQATLTPTDAHLARWQTRRGRLLRARLTLDAERCERWLHTRRIEEQGISDLSLRMSDGAVVLAFTARVGEREASVTARMRVAAGGAQQLVASFDEVRCYGHLGMPALRVALMLPEAALGRHREDDVLAPALVGVSGVRLAPLGRVLWDTLPPGGWRLPSYRHVRLDAVRLSEGRLELDFGSGGGGRAQAGALSVPPGDELLAQNELDAALLAYRAAAAMTGATVELQERILSILSTSVATWDEAIRMASELERSPDRRAAIAGRLVLAELGAEQGDFTTAAARYAELADEAERAGEPEDADAAALRAAELHLAMGSPSALAHAMVWLERVVARRLQPRAAALLASRYTEEGRWDDLAQLERRWVTHAPDAQHEAQARLRLGRVYLHRLAEPARAREELERAARLYPIDADLWLTLAEARRAVGDRNGALRALDRAVELGGDVQRAAAEALRPAILSDAPLGEESPNEPEHGDDESGALDRHEEEQAAATYEEILALRPDDPRALEALADLYYRRREVPRARELYARLAEVPAAAENRELWKRRGELAEAEGDYEEAERHYRRAVEIDAAYVEGYEAIARLALRRDDPATLFTALKAILDTLPLDAVDRITELRQRLGDLALRVGNTTAARTYYELVMAQRPDSIEALTPLADLYGNDGDWEMCAEALGRLSYLVTTPRQRATMLFRQAEVYRLHLGQNDKASSAYLKAADIDPTHQPTLRRLVAYYFSTFDTKSMREVVDELETHGTPLEEVAAVAGMGFALAGDDSRATRYLAEADAPALAEALSLLQVREPAAIDRPLEVALHTLAHPSEAGPEEEQPPELILGRALDERLRGNPADVSARLARARLAEQMGDIGRARMHDSVLTFIDPSGPVARHLGNLPEAPLPIPELPRRSDILRSALGVLGPLVIGLAPPVAEGESLPEWSEELGPLGASFGFTDIPFVTLDDLGEPAWAEPTAPPRVVLRRDLLEDAPAVRFAAARALYLLRAGVSLIHGRSTEDVAALLHAAAALLGGTQPPGLPYVSTWLGVLRALGVDRRPLPLDRRATASMLGEAAQLPDLGERTEAFLVTERLAADHAALILTGDLVAALRALCPPAQGTPARARALTAAAELRAFVELVTG